VDSNGRNGSHARDRVLVVDDEPQVLLALEDQLSDHFQVLKSESPEAALDCLAREPRVSVVLSDQRMPTMSGDVLLSRIRERSDAARVLVTGFADLNAVVSAVNEGHIFAYVTKPWDPEGLRMTVQVAADHVRLTRELAQERKLLLDLMNAIPDAIFFKDLEHRYQRVNRAFMQLVGEGAEATVLGRRLSEVLPHEASSKELEAMERSVVETGKPDLDVVAEQMIRHRKRWFSTTKAPVTTPSGDVIGIVGISRDVTERIETQAALAESAERLRLTFEGSGAGLFDWNITSGEIRFAPGRVNGDRRSLGDGNETYDAMRARVHPEDRSGLDRMLADHLKARVPFAGLEMRARDATGTYRWFEVSGQAVWDTNGKPTRLVGSSIDISSRKAQEQRIERLTRTRAVLSGVSASILRTRDRASLLRAACDVAVRVGELAMTMAFAARGPEAHRLVASEGASEELGALLESWLATALMSEDNALALTLKQHLPTVLDELSTAALPFASELERKGYRTLAFVPIAAEGRLDTILVLIAAEPDFFDAEQVSLLSELAENLGFALDHLAQRDRLDLLAYYDELTGLANRTLLVDKLEQQAALCRIRGEKFALILINVGRFRHVNETLGRRAGDALLVELSTRLRAATEAKDTLARLVGDSFAILLPEVDDEAHVAQFVEQRIIPTVATAFVIADTELRMSTKVGIALFPADAADAGAMLANTEAALKKAKSSGQDYVFYAPSMNDRVAEKLTLETKLRRALDRSEFCLHYQPKIELRNGTVVGAEALIRWQDPDKGLVPPGLFIPVLEETGLILEVGRWVIEHAVEQYVAWGAAGATPPRIAVNVSALQLAHRDFVGSLEALLSRHPSAARGLEIELTESVLMDDLTGNIEKLRAVKAMGVTVAIDDFGTGYSSLGYLSRLPIDALKIDRSFVVRMTEDPQEMSIVTTIISLSHSLDLKVIAEGVETSAQSRLLRLLKCDEIQGYLIAKPQPAKSFIELVGTSFDSVLRGV
jgi:diguanylate cyclase (GGDEF)-like protein/PAS domain S-box-containing protein